MKQPQIDNLMSALNEFREIDPEMNVKMMLAFLEVAKDEGVHGRALEDKLNLSHATAARLLRAFDRIKTKGSTGHDLFKVELDKTDYKIKLRYLNDKGKALLARISQHLNNH